MSAELLAAIELDDARDERAARGTVERCPKRVPPASLPPSFPVESAREHPRWRYELEPGAQCRRATGHAGPHVTESGMLRWHDPVRITVV